MTHTYAVGRSRAQETGSRSQLFEMAPRVSTKRLVTRVAINTMSDEDYSNNDLSDSLIKARQLLSRYSKDELNNIQLEIEDLFFENALFNEETWIETDYPSLILQNCFNLKFNSLITERTRSDWNASLVLFLIIRRKQFEDNPNYRQFVHQALALANSSDERANFADSIKQFEKSELAQVLNDAKHDPTRELRAAAFREYEIVRQALVTANKTPTYDNIAEKVWPRIRHLNKHPSTGKRLIGKDDPDDRDGIAVSRLVVWFGQGVTDGELTATR